MKEHAEEVENSGPAIVRKRKREALESLVGDIFSTTSIRAEQLVKADPNDPSISLVTEENRDLRENEAIAAIPVLIGEAEQEIKSQPLQAQGLRHEGSRPKNPSMLHSSRATSFTAAEPTAEKMLSVASGPPLASNGPDSSMITGNITKPANSTFFAGLKFCHNIAEQCDGLEKALIAHGGILVSEQARLAGEAVDFIVVRL